MGGACAEGRRGGRLSPYWRADGTGWGADLAYLAPTRVSDVVYPDRKGVLMDESFPPWSWALWPSGKAVSLGDGSVRSVPRSGFDHTRSVWRDLVGQGAVNTTRDGLGGIDF